MAKNIKQKANNPMSEYLLKLQLIVTNSEFMNKEEAKKYETFDSKVAGEAYVNAVLKRDTFDSYTWDPGYLKSAFVELGYPEDIIRKFLEVPEYIPANVKNSLVEGARERRIKSFKEANKYYLNLAGLPMELKDPFIPIPDEFYELYKNNGDIHRGSYVHDLDKRYQELFMNSSYYKDILKQYPNVEYLKHLGSFSIPIEVSRIARDGDILLINTGKLQTFHEIFGNVTVSPEIVHEFTNVYKKTQKYIYNTLRGDFEQIYPNYNSMIRFLTIYMTIGGCLNEFMHKSSKLIHMNNIIANDYFTLYGLPSALLEGNSLVKFLKKFRKLLMDKGTNTVYRVKDLIGYEYTDIYTLVMVKQQAFKNGYPVYRIDEETGKRVPVQDIVFRRLGTAEDNASYFQFKNSNKTYTVEEITSGDPRWWNTPEVQQMIQDMNYTLSNSKYIQLSTAMSMDDVWWQTCILLRGLLDNKSETKFTMIGISQALNGISNISVFEAALLLIILMTWSHTDFNGRSMVGNMYLPNGTFNNLAACVDMLFNGLNEDGSPKPLIPGLPYKIASFNFEIKQNEVNKYNKLTTYEYLEPDTFISMLDRILDKEDVNVGETIMNNVKILYEYLEMKLRTASTIHEFRQVTDAYNWLFLVDPNRKWSDDDSKTTDELLCTSYSISISDLNVMKRYFQNNDNETVKVYYENGVYDVNIGDVLNANVLNLTDYPFNDNGFVKAFDEAVLKWRSATFEGIAISAVILTNYKQIIIDKVLLDVSNTTYGPKTFEALLYRENPELYRGLQYIRNDGEELLILMRSIIRALEVYTDSKLSALEFAAVGEDEYIKTLKEVITYFKSYMVEFTKSEFSYIFDGLFDNGGNSNMLLLFDEIPHGIIRILPRDALHLYDASYATVRLGANEMLPDQIYDQVLFRIKTKFLNIKNLDPTEYEVLYDDGKNISNTPFNWLTDTDTIITNIYQTDDSLYRIIINKNNVNTINHGNYVGNVR